MLLRPENRKPNYRELEKVLQKQVPGRPTLFEFIMNDRVYTRLSGYEKPVKLADQSVWLAKAFDSAGYDYVMLWPPWDFSEVNVAKEKTRSLNHAAQVYDRKTFDSYPWPKIEDIDFSYIHGLKDRLPEGMKIVASDSSGIYEAAVKIFGFENLCMFMYDEPELVSDVFERAGEILFAFYQEVLKCPDVISILCSDDWGYKTQIMLTPEQMRKYVFPFHKRYVELAHASGRFAILHSCGCYKDIIEDVIEDMKYDARHSYEDTIIPIEEAYQELQGRIAVLGGIDINFMARHSPKEIFDRSKKLLKQTASGGGYALGTGNSIPEFIPDENYFAMLKAAWSDEL